LVYGLIVQLLHLYAFFPQEVQYIAEQDGLSYAEVIAALEDAAVGLALTV
jgi:FO synthase subunit 2